MLPVVFQPLVWALCCPLYCCRCRLLQYGEGKRWPFFSGRCRRHTAHFTADGVAFYTTARVNVGNLSAIGVGVKLLNFTAVGAAFYTTARAISARCFSAVGVGVMLPF